MELVVKVYQRERNLKSLENMGLPMCGIKGVKHEISLICS